MVFDAVRWYSIYSFFRNDLYVYNIITYYTVHLHGFPWLTTVAEIIKVLHSAQDYGFCTFVQNWVISFFMEWPKMKSYCCRTSYFISPSPPYVNPHPYGRTHKCLRENEKRLKQIKQRNKHTHIQTPTMTVPDRREKET